MGLGKRTELNGVLVKLLHWYKQAGRWAVTCAYGFNDKEVLVQPQNLDAGFLHAPVVMQRLSQKVEEILDKLQPKMLKVHGQSQKPNKLSQQHEEAKPQTKLNYCYSQRCSSYAAYAT